MEHSQSPFAGHFAGDAVAFDGMLWDVSSKLARAQIARQVANNSSLRRPQQSKIHKPVSTGNSPQNVSRRRMAAHHNMMPHHPDMYPQVSRRRAITAASQHPGTEFRPTTWHYEAEPSPAAPGSYRHTMYEQTQQAFEPQPFRMPDMSTYYGNIFDGSVDRYLAGSRAHMQPTYQHVPISSDWATDSLSMTPHAASPAYSVPSARQPGLVQNQMDTFSQTFAPITPSSMRLLPRLEQPVSVPQDPSATTSPQGRNTDDLKDMGSEPELVGMGLYDKPEQSSLLFSAIPTGGSPGKSGCGLMLEDSWSPPEDEDDDKSEDGDGDGDDDDDDDDDDADSDQQDDEEIDTESEDSVDPAVYGSNNMLPQLDINKKSFFIDEQEAMLGAAALAGLTMAEWAGTPHTWTA